MQQQEQSQPVRVIVADDETLIRMNLRETLVGLGYLVVGEASNGDEAIKLAREQKPDVVIMDIKMPPGMDGIAAARLLTAEKIAPVLLLTAYNDRELVAQAKEAGVVGYLVKPFREADLVPQIEVTIARFGEFRKLEQQLGNLQDALDARKVIERAKGLLMERYNLSEQDAFRRIQKRSMDTRKSMREIADAVLLTDEMERQ